MSEAGTARRRWRRPPMIANPWLRHGIVIGAVVYFLWAFSTLPFDWQRIVEGVPRAARIFSSALPPSFARHELLLGGFLESLQISIIATALGVLVSGVVAFMSARNLAIMPIYALGRAILIVSRSFHPVIVAILFVKAVGFGPLAGILTLMIYSIGFVGKLLAERIEEIDPGQLEAIRATGAGPMKVLWFAVLPQVLPRYIGLSIYQLDSNLRASAVVGVVGAGGIGATLMNAFGRYDYDFAFAILIVIVAAILIAEGVGGRIRKNLW